MTFTAAKSVGWMHAPASSSSAAAAAPSITLCPILSSFFSRLMQMLGPFPHSDRHPVVSTTTFSSTTRAGDTRSNNNCTRLLLVRPFFSKRPRQSLFWHTWIVKPLAGSKTVNIRRSDSKVTSRKCCLRSGNRPTKLVLHKWSCRNAQEGGFSLDVCGCNVRNER